MSNIVGSNLGAGGAGASASSCATGTVNAVANQLLIVAASSIKTGGASIPTVSGLSLTWTQFATINNGSGGQAITLFRAMPLYAVSGVITANFGSVQDNGSDISCDGFLGVDTSGTNGAGAIVSTNIITGNVNSTSITLSLAALKSRLNALYGVTGPDGGGRTITVSAGLTELRSGAPSFGGNEMETAWALNTTSGTWTISGSSDNILGIAVELQALKYSMGGIL